MKRWLTVGILITISLLFSSSDSSNPTARKAAEALLQEYNYKIARQESSREVRLDPQWGALVLEASKESGFPLEAYLNQTVRADTYKLSVKSQFRQSGDVHAVILRDTDRRIIGAYIWLYDYMPGIVSLTNRSELHPETLKPYKPEFRGVTRVEILGPWRWEAEDHWTNRREYVGAAASDILNAINRPRTVRGEMPASKGGNEYLLVLQYEDGPVVRIRYYKDLDRYTIDGYEGLLYQPSGALTAILSSGLT